MIKKVRVFQKNIYLCFTDYTKAFDCVYHNKQWNTIKGMGIPDHLTWLLRNLYAGQEATIRTGHGTTAWFQIRKGECQGYIPSSCLFSLYAEYIMWNARLHETQAGIKIARRNINNLRYADNTILMAESEEDLKNLLKVKKESEREQIHVLVSQFSCSVMSNSLRPHESQHIRLPCLSPTSRVYSNPCPSSRWCHPAISSSVVPFSSCPQSVPASGSFPMSQHFTWGGQSTVVSASASVLPMNTQDWSPLGWTGWISLQSKGLSRVFSNTIVQKHQIFGAQLSSQFNSYIHTWPLEKP